MSDEPKKRWYQISIKRALGATAIVAFGLGIFSFLRSETHYDLPYDFSTETVQLLAGILIGLMISTPFLAVGFLFRHLWIGAIFGAVIGGVLGYLAWGIMHA